MPKDYAENFLEAMDLIVQKRLENLKYDKTILCEVIEVLDDEQRVYRVSDGSNTFIAYAISSQFVFEEGDSVYVNVPNGDYNQQKYILGREVTDKSKDYTYLNPMEQFFDMTGNLLESEDTELIDEDGQKIPGSISLSSSLLANNSNVNASNYQQQEGYLYKTLGTIRVADGAAYNRLAIQADFMSHIPQALNGNYGLLFKFNSQNKAKASEETENITPNSILFDSSDMWGNPYDFENYYTQSLVYDITDWEDIETVQIIFYQTANFYSREDRTVLIDHTIPGTDELLPDNLFVDNIKLMLGYEASNEEKIVIYTKDSLTYSSSLTDEQNKKTVNLRWSHVLKDPLARSVALINWEKVQEHVDLENYTVKIHWYRFDRDSNDELAGTYWKEVSNDEVDSVDYQHLFNYIFIPQSNLNNEYIKCIVEIIDNKSLDEINDEYEDKKSEIESELQALQNDIDSLNAHLEFLKLSNVSTSGSIIGLYDNDITTTETLIAEKQDEYEKTNKRLNRLKLDVSSCYTYLKSDILTFTSEINKEDESAIDYVQGLGLSCDDDGVYRIYDTLTNDLISSSQQHKDRIIRLNFKSLLTQDQNAGITQVRWYIPRGNTMIQEPIAGINYTEQHTDEYDERIEITDDYYIIVRSNPKIISHSSGTYSTKDCVVEQTYRIKPHLLQSDCNNVIKCEVVRNNITYGPSEKELIFGVVGSNGTNNTLIISMGSEYNKTTNELVEAAPPAWTLGENNNYIQLHHYLYDEDNKLVNDLIKSIEYSVVYGPGFSVDNSTERLTLSGQGDRGCIIKCKVRLEDGITNAEKDTEDQTVSYEFVRGYTAYLVVACRADRTIKWFDGADRVVYSSAGGSPSYYKATYKVNDVEVGNAIALDGSNNLIELRNILHPGNNYLPYVRNLMLSPRSMYLADVEYDVCVKCYNGDNFVLGVPILVLQNQWASSVLNDWDGSFYTNEEKGLVLGTMLGAGKKEPAGDHANTFSGVLMGNVSAGAKDTASGIGLYGYQYGIQSFGFNVNGKAFIGKQQKSQILFDGNNGTIKNYAFDHGNNTGIQLNMNGDDDSDQTFIIRKNGTDIVKLSSGSPYLTIRGTDKKVRMKVDDSGATIGAWKLNETTLTAGNITLNSNGSMYGGNSGRTWKIDTDGTATFNYLVANGGGYIAGWEISSDTLSGGDTTICSDGTITCRNLIATNTGSIGPYKISSSSLSGNGISLNGSTIKVGNNLILTSEENAGSITLGSAKIRAGDKVQTVSINKDLILLGSLNANNNVSAQQGNFDRITMYQNGGETQASFDAGLIINIKSIVNALINRLDEIAFKGDSVTVNMLTGKGSID